MSPLELTLLALAGSAFLGLLLHFARVEREKRARLQEEKRRQSSYFDASVDLVARRYVEKVRTGESSGPKALLEADVLSLGSDALISSALGRIAALGVEAPLSDDLLYRLRILGQRRFLLKLYGRIDEPFNETLFSEILEELASEESTNS